MVVRLYIEIEDRSDQQQILLRRYWVAVAVIHDMVTIATTGMRHRHNFAYIPAYCRVRLTARQIHLEALVTTFIGISSQPL
jgi:hypothetical protein